MQCNEKEFKVISDGTCTKEQIENARNRVKTVISKDRFEIACKCIFLVGKEYRKQVIPGELEDEIDCGE